jgi:hypothetical protein
MNSGTSVPSRAQRVGRGEQQRAADRRAGYRQGEPAPALPQVAPVQREDAEQHLPREAVHQEQYIDRGQERQDGPRATRRRSLRAQREVSEEESRERHEDVVGELELEREGVGGVDGQRLHLGQEAQHHEVGNAQGQHQPPGEGHERVLAMARIAEQVDQHRHGEEIRVFGEKGGRVTRVAVAVERAGEEHPEEQQGRQRHRILADGAPFLAPGPAEEPREQDDRQQDVVERGRNRDRGADRDGRPAR